MELKKMKVFFKAIGEDYILDQHNFGGLKLSFVQVLNNSENEIQSFSQDIPELDFFDKWNKLRKYLLMFTELEETEDRVRVVQLDIKELEEDLYSLAMHGHKKLEFSTGALYLKTPIKSEVMKDDAEYQESCNMPKDLSKLLRELIECADRYVKGHRLQAKLFDVEDEQA